EGVVQEEPAAVAVVVLVYGQADLPQVRLALGPVGRLSDFLDSGQQQADQHADDGDDDQQLDQRERTSVSHDSLPCRRPATPSGPGITNLWIVLQTRPGKATGFREIDIREIFSINITEEFQQASARGR